MGARYWIYDDPATGWARVHCHSCGYCRDGRGVYNKTGPRKGDRWIGPFNERSSAFGDLGRLRRSNSGGCTVCKP